MDSSRLATVDFPDYPHSELKHDDGTPRDELRAAYAKASAYVKLALITADDVEVSKEAQLAAAATDATHTLEEHDDSDEYLALALQELAYAIAEADDPGFSAGLESVRQTVAEAHQT